MTLWNKGTTTEKAVEEYTVGNDPTLDIELLPYDCKASIAHAKTLAKIGILDKKELEMLEKELLHIKKLAEKGEFPITQAQEDGHTAIEEWLTKKLGSVGKKIHTGRSRNDQVLAALQLYEITQLEEIKQMQAQLVNALQQKITKQGEIELPGYTHTQKAMANTVANWLGAFIAAAKDNNILVEAVQKLLDQSPLGSAAGFGTPGIPLDNEYTAKEAGFSKVMQPVTYAQHSRGKFSANILHTLSQIMQDANKLATDLILFNTTEFNYVQLPSNYCTGSSIMPQKKNPDVLELVRANYHVVLGEEFKVKSLNSNLISGYHRDMQLTKEPVIKSFQITLQTINIMSAIVANMTINKKNCTTAMSEELYATQKVYELIKKGVPFRDAYLQVKQNIN